MVIPTSNIHIPRIMTGILCVPHSIGTLLVRDCAKFLSHPSFLYIF